MYSAASVSRDKSGPVAVGNERTDAGNRCFSEGSLRRIGNIGREMRADGLGELTEVPFVRFDSEDAPDLREDSRIKKNGNARSIYLHMANCFLSDTCQS